MIFKIRPNEASKMVPKWSQNPQKSPPEAVLKTEPPKMVNNDSKLLPKGSQMETPARIRMEIWGSREDPIQ